MKKIKKIPSESPLRTQMLLEDGWQPLKEPPSMPVLIALALPISFLLLYAAGSWLAFLFPEFRSSLNFSKITFRIDWKFLFYIMGIFFCTFVHEFLHLLMIPNVFQSEKTFWGLNGFFGFVYSEEILTKSRFMLVSIMPLILLSFILPLLLRLSGIYRGYFMLLFMINAAGSCVDVFNMLLVAFQVPQGGHVVGNGPTTYYRA
ncbi:MAG: DUF3267 domain-containing protein [Peptostreptococcaceae bacterium]|nr:DUF3267 domain-containing protein [Peptostreptococcaceae bacterium]